MSRSTREPWYTDGYKGSQRRQFFKKYANKIIRNSEEIPNGKAYRKFYCSWNICDYKYCYSPFPYVYWNKGVAEWHYEERPWRVCNK